jgi:hypothetical protein
MIPTVFVEILHMQIEYLDEFTIMKQERCLHLRIFASHGILRLCNVLRNYLVPEGPSSLACSSISILFHLDIVQSELFFVIILEEIFAFFHLSCSPHGASVVPPILAWHLTPPFHSISS